MTKAGKRLIAAAKEAREIAKLDTLLSRLSTVDENTSREELREIDAEIFCIEKGARLVISDAGYWHAVYPDDTHDTLGSKFLGRSFKTYLNDQFFPRYTADLNSVKALEREYLADKWWRLSGPYDGEYTLEIGVDRCVHFCFAKTEEAARCMALLKAMEATND